jgi:hypothetical protein
VLKCLSEEEELKRGIQDSGIRIRDQKEGESGNRQREYKKQSFLKPDA